MTFSHLMAASMTSVHFSRNKDFLRGIDSSSTSVFTASLGEVKTEDRLLFEISSTMRFPEYFGWNWDALDECLRDMEWLPEKGCLLILEDAEQCWSQYPYLLIRLVAAWLDASEYWEGEKRPFHLVFVM